MNSCPLHLRWCLLLCVLVTKAITAAGQDWEAWQIRQPAAATTWLSGVCHGNGLFVAVGWEGLIDTSVTGENWHPQVSGTSADLFNVGFGHGLFVAVGAGGAILTSPDGTNWTVRSSGVGSYLRELSFGAGWFVAGGFSPNAILVSSNGVDWDPIPEGVAAYPDFIAFGRGRHVLESGRTNLVLFDGTHWTTRASGLPENLYTMGYGNGFFLAIDIRNRVFTSPDAAHWRHRATLDVVRPEHVVFGHGTFVVDGGSHVVASQDAEAWTRVTPDFVRNVGFGDGTFIGVGMGAGIAQSDPITWLRSEGAGRIELHGPTDHVYEIQQRAGWHEEQAWTLAGRVSVTNSPAIWIDPEPDLVGQRYYRVLMDPP